MGKPIMAICGFEEIYFERMYEYILLSYGEDFEVVLFTNEDSFKDFIINNPVDVLIAEEEFNVPEERKVGVRINLSDEPGKENSVYKYMSCEKIMKEAMAVCAAAQTAVKGFESDGKTKIIGVYTPIKRCFQTTFALTVGQILARNHKVLYLNFESYSGFDVLFHSKEKTDLMDLVYFSECGSDNIAYRIESIKEKIGNLDYINPIKIYTKYSEISKDQWERLLDNLTTKTDYEYIILDLSEQVNGLLNILQRCTRIYTITDSERMSSAKIAQYENLLRESSYSDVANKTQNITIPKFREIPGNFEMLPYSELAEYLRKIIAFDNEEDMHE